MINKYVIAAIIAILIVLVSYFLQFYYMLNYNISDSPENWGQLGDYVGGLLNPILSFFSLILLIKSLGIQNHANKSLMDDLKNKEKAEKLRSFEVLFFNMINSQKLLFDTFEVRLMDNDKETFKKSVDAVLAIENEIRKIRLINESDSEINRFLEDIDYQDKLFGLVRVFYIIVKIISEKLSDNMGFTADDRKEHFNTLINFTEFSQLRMIKICIQFANYESTNYLKRNTEFNEIMTKVGLNTTIY